MPVNRYITHAVLLLVAVTLSGFATVGRSLPASFGLRLGAVNAEGLVIGEGGHVGDVNLGRLVTIMKPISVPTSALTPREPVRYTVGDNEDLAAVAARFKLSVEQVRWSNPALKTTDKVQKGDLLVLAPVPGVVVRVQAGDTLGTLSQTFNVEPATIADFNRLRDPDLVPDQVLVIPNGRGPDFAPPEPPAPDPADVVRPTIAARPAVSQPAAQVASAPAAPVSANGRFPWGYCTWYVATRRNVTWLGNAWEWYGNARAQGLPEGSTPRPGAIMVTWESGYGHVAYVEAVNADGSWRVSEMNFVGFGIQSGRTIRPGGVPLIGFIY